MKIENDKIVAYSGNELKEFIASEVEEEWRERNFVDKVRSYCNGISKRVLLVSGLRSTGKTTGILQGIPKDDTVFICPVSKGSAPEKLIKDTIIDFGCKNIIIDEYTWIKWEKDSNSLTNFLAGQTKIGKKVILTGTESVLINKLRNTELIHRDNTIFTTYFSYDEYCRLYDAKKNDISVKDFLTRGGIFENHASKNSGSMKDYVQCAIIDNLSSYYKDYDESLLKVAVYTIFYECVCNCYSKNDVKTVPGYNYDINQTISYEEYLENFELDPSIIIPTSILSQISDKLAEIGVVIKLQDFRLPSHNRSYITNPTISAWLTKCIFEVEDLDERYLGHLYESAVVCYEYMKIVADSDRYKLGYMHGRRHSQEYEIDFIIYDDTSAYVFDCKLNDNSNAVISDKASIVKDVIENILSNKDIDIKARYVIYQGKEKYYNANNKDIIFTNDWDIDFTDFERQVIALKHGSEGGDDGNQDNITDAFNTALYINADDKEVSEKDASDTSKVNDNGSDNGLHETTSEAKNSGSSDDTKACLDESDISAEKDSGDERDDI